MFFQFDMASLDTPKPEPVSDASGETTDLLRQLVELQREQVSHLRFLVANQDVMSRWRAFVSRWRNDFPDLPDSCRQSLPILERTYGKLIAELTEHLSNDGDSIDNEFGLQEFLDRYGLRLGQLGTLLNLVAPLAETGSPSESA